MKKISLIILALTITLGACKKGGLSENAPANNDPNYDAHNSIFRVKASSTAEFKVTITEYGNDGVTPYNTENADQTTAFDYGFTPVVGHKITVAIQSANGLITSSVMYKGIYLDPVTIKTSGGGSTGSFSYTVPN
jgi:hypothetical protein